MPVTKIKAKKFRDEFPSNPIEKFKDYYALVFELITMQYATKNLVTQK